MSVPFLERPRLAPQQPVLIDPHLSVLEMRDAIEVKRVLVGWFVGWFDRWIIDGRFGKFVVVL